MFLLFCCCWVMFFFVFFGGLGGGEGYRQTDKGNFTDMEVCVV